MMRSFRAKPVGWRHESYRHYLAAKGVRTRYNADKYDTMASFLHNAVDDGRAKVPDFHEQHRHDMVNSVVRQYSDEFSRAEGAGELRAGATKSFLQDDLTNECKDFIDEKIDEQTFRANLARRAAKHRQQYSSTLDVWGAMEGKGHEADHLRGKFMPEVLQEPKVYAAKKEWTNRIKGGLGDDLTPYDFTPDQMKRAVDVEMEHTNDRDVAASIALDHMAEFGPRYYDELAKMESKLKRKPTDSEKRDLKRNLKYMVKK